MLHRLKGGGFRLRLKAGLIGHSADLNHMKTIIRLRQILFLNIFLPYLIRNIDTRGNPVTSRPQMLAPITFLQHLKLS